MIIEIQPIAHHATSTRQITGHPVFQAGRPVYAAVADQTFICRNFARPERKLSTS